MARTWREVGHLARRFARAWRPEPPHADEEAWVRGQLRPGEVRLWAAQAAIDRAHTLAVTRAVLLARPDAPEWVVSAALLHDVGKATVPLGPPGRALATLAELAGLADAAPGRLGAYLAYTDRGAEMLTAAGSDPLVVAWAREHHEPAERWTVPEPWGEVLAAADRDAL